MAFSFKDKLGQAGVVNMNKCIPVLGGVIGVTVDAVSTYTLAQTANAILKELGYKEGDLKDIIS